MKCAKNILGHWLADATWIKSIYWREGEKYFQRKRLEGGTGVQANPWVNLWIHVVKWQTGECGRSNGNKWQLTLTALTAPSGTVPICSWCVCRVQRYIEFLSLGMRIIKRTRRWGCGEKRNILRAPQMQLLQRRTGTGACMVSLIGQHHC